MATSSMERSLIRSIVFESSDNRRCGTQRRGVSDTVFLLGKSKNASDKALFLLLRFLWASKENEGSIVLVTITHEIARALRRRPIETLGWQYLLWRGPFSLSEGRFFSFYSCHIMYFKVFVNLLRQFLWASKENEGSRTPLLK